MWEIFPCFENFYGILQSLIIVIVELRHSLDYVYSKLLFVYFFIYFASIMNEMDATSCFSVKDFFWVQRLLFLCVDFLSVYVSQFDWTQGLNFHLFFSPSACWHKAELKNSKINWRARFVVQLEADSCSLGMAGECWFPSQMLHFWSMSLSMHVGR